MDVGVEDAMNLKHLCMVFVTGLLCTGFLSSVSMQPGNYGRIIFVSSRDVESQIYTMNPDGSEQTRISSSTCVYFLPKSSPDGRKIAYTLDCGIMAIYVMNADGSNCRNLSISISNSTIPPDCGSPTWSPDGEKIAFSVGNYISVMNADGGNVQWIYHCSSCSTWSPDWSPDGKKIAFASGRPGQESVFVMDADGTNVRKVVPHGSDPVWSPDGKKIAFDSERDGNKDIYVMDADGGHEMRLTSDLAHDWRPAWSPEGKKIAFVSDRDGNEEIYVMNADGTNQVNITNNPADDRDPDWCCQSLIEHSTSTPPATEEPSRTEEYSVIVVAAIIFLTILAVLIRRKNQSTSH